MKEIAKIDNLNFDLRTINPKYKYFIIRFYIIITCRDMEAWGNLASFE